MKFIDEAEILVTAGDGGAGLVSFRRARNAPRLGPDGGSGGIGGDVIVKGDRNLNTLNSLRYQRIFKAEDGGKGGSNNCTGRGGSPVIIPVPLGTLVYHSETRKLFGELIEDGQELIVAKGGYRGLGNLCFTSSTQRAPEFSTQGKPGETFPIKLEVKLIADIGLAGLPNAGKSTLLSRISDAKPKIADYPFTTLVPNLGVVNLAPVTGSYESFVVADIPGLIEGASLGKGLGDKFLRHLERTKIIVYILDAFQEEPGPLESFEILRKELAQYSSSFLYKKVLVVLNKLDLAGDDRSSFDQHFAAFKNLNYDVQMISGHSGEGLKELILKMYQLVEEEKAQSSLSSEELFENDPDLGQGESEETHMLEATLLP